MAIHPQAFVDPKAELGTDVSVGAFAFIGAHTTIGDGCRIDPHAVIHPYTRLGRGCAVHAAAVLGDRPQDLAFDGDTVSYVEIGEECVFREGVTVHRGTKPDTVTRIGNRCFLMANSHVAHNCQLGDDVIFANGVLLGGYVEIGDRAFLSGNVVVHQFCRVGALAMLSGLSAASKDVPPYCILENSETNRLAGLNVVGMRRAGLTPDQRADVKRVFQLLFRREVNLRDAIEESATQFPNGPAAVMWQFAQASKRGVCTM